MRLATTLLVLHHLQLQRQLCISMSVIGELVQRTGCIELRIVPSQGVAPELRMHNRDQQSIASNYWLRLYNSLVGSAEALEYLTAR